MLYPFGIPLASLFVLYRSRVPHLAAWKRDCAWLRAIVQRAMVLGATTSQPYNADTITTESITLEHLRMLHTLFVEAEEDKPTVSEDRSASTRLHNGGSMSLREPGGGATVRQLLLNQSVAHAFDHAVPAGTDEDEEQRLSVRLPHAASSIVVRQPRAEASALPLTSEPTLRRRASTLSTRSLGASAPTPPPENRFAALLFHVRQRLGRVAHATTLQAKTMRRTLSTILYQSERDLLMAALLERAKHDKQSFVAQPSDNMLRWRTQYEWQALRASGVQLGERDSTERAAFYKFRFLFADYSVHAWYWESIDLLQKLFLTSLISFIAPHTSVQVVVACMFAFGE
jgi:hypothetical protein